MSYFTFMCVLLPKSKSHFHNTQVAIESGLFLSSCLRSLTVHCSCHSEYFQVWGCDEHASWQCCPPPGRVVFESPAINRCICVKSALGLWHSSTLFPFYCPPTPPPTASLFIYLFRSLWCCWLFLLLKKQRCAGGAPSPIASFSLAFLSFISPPLPMRTEGNLIGNFMGG